MTTNGVGPGDRMPAGGELAPSIPDALVDATLEFALQRPMFRLLELDQHLRECFPEEAFTISDLDFMGRAMEAARARLQGSGKPATWFYHDIVIGQDNVRLLALKVKDPNVVVPTDQDLYQQVRKDVVTLFGGRDLITPEELRFYLYMVRDMSPKTARQYTSWLKQDGFISVGDEGGFRLPGRELPAAKPSAVADRPAETPVEPDHAEEAEAVVIQLSDRHRTRKAPKATTTPLPSVPTPPAAPAIPRVELPTTSLNRNFSGLDVAVAEGALMRLYLSARYNAGDEGMELDELAEHIAGRDYPMARAQALIIELRRRGYIVVDRDPRTRIETLRISRDIYYKEFNNWQQSLGNVTVRLYQQRNAS